MSAPTFTTLPREIRDRIYDFVWDFGQPVGPSGWSSKYMPRSMQRSSPFDSVPIHAMLALLHVNHQISAEAAAAFCGQRKFYSAPSTLSFPTHYSPFHHVLEIGGLFRFSRHVCLTSNP